MRSDTSSGDSDSGIGFGTRHSDRISGVEDSDQERKATLAAAAPVLCRKDTQGLGDGSGILVAAHAPPLRPRARRSGSPATHLQIEDKHAPGDNRMKEATRADNYRTEQPLRRKISANPSLHALGAKTTISRRPRRHRN